MRALFKRLLLRLSEKTGTDTTYLAKGGFWATLQFISSSALSLASVIAFANLLPPDTYGRYKYIISLAGIFGFLSLAGVNTAVTQAVAQGKENILRYAVRYQLRWNLLASLASTVTAIYYFINDNHIVAFSLFFIGIVHSFTSAYNTFGAYLLGKKELRRLTTYNFITNLTSVLPMIGVLFLTDSIVVLAMTYALTSLAPNLFFYYYTLAKFKPSKARIGAEAKDILGYGIRLSFWAGLSNIASNLDKIIIFHYLGAIQVAVYSLATAIPNRVGGYLKNLGAILLPKLAERSLNEIQTVFYKRVLQSIALGLALYVGYILTAPFVYTYILPQYLDSIPYSQILALSLIFLPSANYIGNVFRAHSNITSAYLGTAQTLLRLVLYIITGARYGIWGIVVSTVIMQAVGFITSLILWEYEKHKL